jgi:predicted secreted hydrolase
MADTPQDYQRLGIGRGRVVAFEDGMRTTGQPGDYEWWYFDANLDDGAKIVVNFATSRWPVPPARWTRTSGST